MYSSNEMIGAISMTVLCLMISIGNIVAILLILYRSKKEFSYILISLFVSDTLLGLTNVFIFLINAINKQWSGGTETCRIIAITGVLFCCQSVLSLFFIAFDRYMIIVQEHKLSQCKIAIGIGTTWIFSILLSTPVLYNSKLKISITSSGYYCMYEWYDQDTIAVPIICILVLFTSLVGTALFYWAMYKKVVSPILSYVEEECNSPHVTSFMSAQTQQKRLKDDEQLSFRMKILVVSFTFNWFPYLINMTYQVISQTESSPWFDGISLGMGYANSFLNPLIYIWMDRKHLCK